MLSSLTLDLVEKYNGRIIDQDLIELGHMTYIIRIPTPTNEAITSIKSSLGSYDSYATYTEGHDEKVCFIPVKFQVNIDAVYQLLENETKSNLRLANEMLRRLS